ncbi:hypothetical protein PUV54_10620 [Hyphococcus flavus]|uniref:Uncharacterized protein n=1 Tax=Hyphococcus flavus TaxID=1866326 RepID=A0AAE9ZGG8_9PROT|nr:hypothetical protein [Hyphococcus flavus]WDI30411.1 hypothetical protein PUV54_10620 [Hyphococcus flavus]
MTFHKVSGPRAFTPVTALARREAGGPYGWLTPYIGFIAGHNDDIAARVLHLRRTELHFIALCLSLMGVKRDDADHLAAFSCGLGRRTRKSLLSEFAPEAEPNLARLSGKLAGYVWRAASYQRLAALYAEPHARKTLCHLPHITRWHLIMMLRLPEPYRKLGILRKIKRRRDLSCVLFGLEIVRRVRTDLNDRQIIASLEKSDVGYVRDWVEAHYERLPFPQAPTGALTDGNGGVLRPVATGGELIRTAREYDNCIDTYIWEAASGASVFYRYDAEVQRIAVAELKRLPGVGWAVNDLLAPKNKPVNGVLRKHILMLFKNAGILAAPQVTGSFSRFNLDF